MYSSLFAIEIVQCGSLEEVSVRRLGFRLALVVDLGDEVEDYSWSVTAINVL